MRKIGILACAASMLAACGIIGTANDPLSQDNIAKFASQVQQFNTGLIQDVGNLNTGGAQALASAGAMGCGLIAMTDPLFTMVAPIAGADAKALATEQTVMTMANKICPTITANSSTLASDVASVLGAVTTQKAALAVTAPTVAAQITTAAPATAAPSS